MCKSKATATVALLAALCLAAPASGVAASPQKIVRKSASDMTRAEVNRFKRAFAYAVRKGYFDDFNASHYDRLRNRQHGADVLGQTPPAVEPGESQAWAYRLLPWHRSFIIEAERMLRAALRERNRREGRSPREARRLFIPYWDAANDQDLPRWVRRFKPRGGRAIVPRGLPRGHAGFGRRVGSTYAIDFERWPRGFLVFDLLPQPEQIAGILGQETWVDFYNALDTNPVLISAALPGAQAGLQTLARKLPDDRNLRTVLAAAQPDYPQDPASQLAAFNAFLAIGHRASVEKAKRRPDRELIRAIRDVYAAFRFPPHLVLHFWAGGLNPSNPNLRGTVTYFNELVVDPVFWMLHSELDRYWYTWERSHDGTPPLMGRDAVFQPIRPREGAWYGGGRRWELARLADHRRLPFRYDEVWRSSRPTAGQAAAFVRPVGSALPTALAAATPPGFICALAPPAL